MRIDSFHAIGIDPGTMDLGPRPCSSTSQFSWICRSSHIIAGVKGKDLRENGTLITIVDLSG